MTTPHFSVEYVEKHNRLTSFFRLFLALPHLIILSASGSLMQALAFFQWWIVLISGKRNNGIWKMQNWWLAYVARAYSYAFLLFDVWPAFGEKSAGEPTTYEFQYEQRADRVSSFFRLLMLIPALLFYLLLAIASALFLLITWFSILFSGKQPRGCFDFILKTHRYWISLYAYGLLMTDSYPTSNP